MTASRPATNATAGGFRRVVAATALALVGVGAGAGSAPAHAAEITPPDGNLCSAYNASPTPMFFGRRHVALPCPLPPSCATGGGDGTED